MQPAGWMSTASGVRPRPDTVDAAGAAAAPLTQRARQGAGAAGAQPRRAPAGHGGPPTTTR
eukprot:6437139-Pyramimonas_sp.AAC.1